MGADYIAVHTGYDLQAEGQSPLESLRTVKSVIKNSKVAVAGGIKPDTIKEIVAENPDLCYCWWRNRKCRRSSRSCKTMSRCNRR